MVQMKVRKPEVIKEMKKVKKTVMVKQNIKVKKPKSPGNLNKTNASLLNY